MSWSIEERRCERRVRITGNLDLEELVASGHRRFRFVCTPLTLVGLPGEAPGPEGEFG